MHLPRMHVRRPARSLASSVVPLTAVLALAGPLSACGFDYATDRAVQYSSAPNYREGIVDVLSAVVVSAEDGSGTVVASLSNNDNEEEHSLTGVSGEGITAGEFEPVVVAPESLVNLADPPVGITVTGEFGAGDFVELTFDFEGGERATFDVPVVPNDSGYWEGLDVS